MQKVIDKEKVIEILGFVREDLIKESEKGFFHGICDCFDTPYFRKRNSLEVKYIVEQMKRRAPLRVKVKSLFTDNFYWWKLNKKNIKKRIKFLNKLIVKEKRNGQKDRIA